MKSSFYVLVTKSLNLLHKMIIFSFSVLIRIIDPMASNKFVEERKTMAELDHPKITVKRQAELLSVNRTSLYREVQAHQESEENIQIMHAYLPSHGERIYVSVYYHRLVQPQSG